MEKIFPATLGRRERLITYGVGYGVGVGVPFVIGVSFAIGFDQPALVILPVPFLIAIGAAYYYRPTGYAVTETEIAILRPVGPVQIPLSDVRQVVHPAGIPEGTSFGLVRVDGIYGTFGTFWNKKWGRHRVYVTDHSKRVELRLADGSRVIVSPDDPGSFLQAMQDAAAEAEAEIAVVGRE